MSWRVTDLLAAWFGYSLPLDPTLSDVTVGVTAVKLWNANARRAKGIISHFGGANIALGHSAAVTATTGIQFSPGQTIELDWQEDYDTVTEELWGISAAAGNAVHVEEELMTGADDS
jgi:hypothetical protein